MDAQTSTSSATSDWITTGQPFLKEGEAAVRACLISLLSAFVPAHPSCGPHLVAGPSLLFAPGRLAVLGGDVCTQDRVGNVFSAMWAIHKNAETERRPGKTSWAIEKLVFAQPSLVLRPERSGPRNFEDP
jgi:hypothetical protein